MSSSVAFGPGNNPFDDLPTSNIISGNKNPSLPTTTSTSADTAFATVNAAAKFLNSNSDHNQEKRARRRREEAVARLVADATRPPDFFYLEDAHIATAAGGGGGAAAATTTSTTAWNDAVFSNTTSNSTNNFNYNAHEHNIKQLEAKLRSQQHSTLLLASTIASSIERGLDRELHSELVRQGKEATSVISKICHDHSDEFLESVGKVVAAFGGPCEEVKNSLEEVRILFLFNIISSTHYSKEAHFTHPSLT
jgi:hypothetical protein